VTDIESRASDLKAQAEIMQVMLASLMESLDEVIYPRIPAVELDAGMEIYHGGMWREVLGVEPRGRIKVCLVGGEVRREPYEMVIARRAR
jgi:hypothetical protein